MDPEQIYQEVLQEEQQKGSASGVAEGRAKAARQRAIQGSPHPKEPRWWPGSQPQFEGGGDGAAPEPAAEAEPEPEPAAEAEPEPEPAAEAEPEPVEEAPAAEAATPDSGDAAQSERPDVAAAAPAAQPAAAAPEPAAQPAAAAVAVEAAPPRPPGVTHGTASGNRLRPEDAVGTDAQFDAQRAMEDRRRLIDELVATGVPAVTASESGRPKAPMLLLAYIVIPLLAIGLLAAAADDEEAGGGAPPAPDGGPTTAIVAEGNAFDVETITLVAGEEASIEVENRDTAQHNVAIYETEAAEEEIFVGDLIDPGSSATYEFEAPPAGEYYFQCDIHPDMNGNVVSE